MPGLNTEVNSVPLLWDSTSRRGVGKHLRPSAAKSSTRQHRLDDLPTRTVYTVLP
jgi:hypothetical protein